MARSAPSIRQDLTVLPADSPKNLGIRFTIKEKIGVAVYNPVALRALIPEGVVVITDEEIIGTGHFPENLLVPEESMQFVRVVG
jgi:hypothetical protein